MQTVTEKCNICQKMKIIPKCIYIYGNICLECWEETEEGQKEFEALDKEIQEQKEIRNRIPGYRKCFND